jgi:hypothetical protein
MQMIFGKPGSAAGWCDEGVTDVPSLAHSHPTSQLVALVAAASQKGAGVGRT